MQEPAIIPSPLPESETQEARNARLARSVDPLGCTATPATGAEPVAGPWAAGPEPPPILTPTRAAFLLGGRWTPREVKKAFPEFCPTNDPEQLPLALRKALETAPMRRQFRGLAAMMAQASAPYQPVLNGNVISWGDIHPEDRDDAERLKSVMEPFLADGDQDSLSGSEFRRVGVEAFRRVFGRPIGERQWWNLFTRVLTRDGGRDDFARREIYLPEVIRRKQDTPVPLPAIATDDCPALSALLNSQGRHHPNTSGGRSIWLEVVRTYEALVAAGEGHRRAVGIVVNHLQKHAAWMSNQSRNTIHKGFDRAWARWIAKGRDHARFTADDREHNGPNSFNPPEADKELLVHCAAMQHGKDLAPAWRQLLRKCLFSDATLRYAATRRRGRKSDVPHVFRVCCAEAARKLYESEFHPKQARLDGAFRKLDWSKVWAGDFLSADDKTLEVYYSPEDDHGNPLMDDDEKPVMRRGQFIPMVDCRSKRILDFVIIDDEGYDAFSIRTLMNKTCLRYGQPRRGFKFEGGLWKKSQLLRGAVQWGEVVTGLHRLGLEISYATNPQAKIVENILGLFTRRLRGEPGFSSINEVQRKNERYLDRRRKVMAGKVPPSKYFYPFSEWCRRLEALVADYNADPQESDVIGAYESPDSAWRRLQNPEDPKLTRLGGDLARLLSSHDTVVTVGRNGLSPTISGNRLGDYLFEEDGQHVAKGRQVKIWVDLEYSQFITFEHPDTGAFHILRRFDPIPAFDATKEQMEDTGRRIAVHNGLAKKSCYYSTIPTDFIPESRLNMCDVRTSQLVATMSAAREEVETEAIAAKQQVTQERKLEREVGIPVDEGRWQQLPPEAREAMRSAFGAVGQKTTRTR